MTEGSMLKGFVQYCLNNKITVVLMIILLVAIGYDVTHIDKYYQQCNDQWKKALSEYNCYPKSQSDPIVFFNNSGLHRFNATEFNAT